MSLSFTEAAMTYLGSKVGVNNKVPAGQSFLIAIAIMEEGGDDSLFLIKGTYSSGSVSNLDKTFSEITEAAGDDKIIVLKLTSGSDVYYLPAVKVTSSAIVFADDVESKLMVTLSSANAVTVGTAGVPSWTDLTDKPFYEEVTAPAINLSNPDYTSAGAVSFNVSIMGSVIPCKAVRMADAIQKTNMIGAELTMQQEADGDDESNTVEIESNRIEDVTNGYMVSEEGIPYLFCALQDNVTFTMLDGNNDQVFSVTLPTAGVFFVQLDASESFGVVIYTSVLTKAATTVVHKLDSKYYEGTYWVNCTWTQNDGYTMDRTYAQIAAADAAGQDVKVRLLSEDILIPVNLTLLARPTQLMPVYVFGLTVDAQLLNGNSSGVIVFSLGITADGSVNASRNVYTALASATGVSF